MRKLISVDKEAYGKIKEALEVMKNDNPFLELLTKCALNYEKSQKSYRKSEEYDENKDLTCCRPVEVTDEMMESINTPAYADEVPAEILRQL